MQQLAPDIVRRRGGGELAEVMRIAVPHGLEPDAIRAVARFYAGR